MRTMTFDEAQRTYDNRAPVEMSDDEAGLRWYIEDAQELIGKAERMLNAGDMQACLDYLHSAGKWLCEAGWAE